MSTGVVEQDEIRNGMSPLPVDPVNAEQSRTAAHVALAASCATNSSGDRSGRAQDNSADAAQSRVSPHLMETAHSCKLRFGQWVPHSIPPLPPDLSLSVHGRAGGLPPKTVT